MSHFNRVLIRFRDEFQCPEMRAQLEAVNEVAGRLQSEGHSLRRDDQRDWEVAHVLLELERLHRARPMQRILDVGGGNGPVAYYLALLGFDVTVLDINPNVLDQVTSTASSLGISASLRGAEGGIGAWMFDTDSFDCAISISVFEGILRRHRDRHFSELRRVLRPGGSLLMTFDFGPDARFVGDGPATVAEANADVIDSSGMQLVGNELLEPVFDPELGPPVKSLHPTVDGYDRIAACYSFCAVHLRNGDAT